MNLEFQFVQTFEKDGVLWRRERADVTRCADFWRVWRSAASGALKNLVYVECIDGKWYANRLKRDDPETGITYLPIDLAYVVKDTSKLLPYQPAAVSYLVQSIINNGAAADGSDTGIGKTYHALAVCRELSVRPCVICRKAGISGWRRACQHMIIDPYLIINWEAARSGKIKVGKRTVLTRRKRDYRIGYDYTWHLPSGVLLIFDEAHLGFNADSQNYALWTAAAGRATATQRPSAVGRRKGFMRAGTCRIGRPVRIPHARERRQRAVGVPRRRTAKADRSRHCGRRR
jgi:hypothetical protein